MRRQAFFAAANMYTFWIIFRWSLLLVLLRVAWGNNEVKISTGRLVGLQGEIDGVTYRSFLGIPYAEPPLASRRFLPPVKKTSWNGVRNATRSGRKCPHLTMSSSIVGQYRYAGSEDCLTLDVFAPSPAQLGNSSQNATYGVLDYERDLAVVIFISSSERQTTGAVMATHGGVAVVVVNYRVGLLGFLTTGNEDAPGNLGLLDQQLAMHWVQENIGSFGGDSDRVTLLGDSLADTTLHLYSPGAERLFRRIIAQSDATTPKSLLTTGSSVQATYQLGAEVGCPISNTSLLIKCLRSKTAQELIITARSSSAYMYYPWVPVFNRVFFYPNMSSSDRMSMSYLNTDVDILIGFSSNEGANVLSRSPRALSTLGLNPASGVTSNTFNQLLSPYIDDISDAVNASLIQLIVLQQYTDWTMPDNDTSRLTSLFEIIGDISVVVPGFDFTDDVFRVSMIDSTTPNIHVYVFDNTFALANMYPLSLNMRLYPATYSMGIPFVNSSKNEFSEEERQLSVHMLRYWTNFAKTGNPNGDESNETLDVPLRWPAYEKPNRRHIIFQTGNLSLGFHYKASDVAFWTITVPQLDVPAINISCPEAVPTNATHPLKVVVGMRLGWKLTPEQAGTALEALLAVAVLFALLSILLTIVSCRMRSALLNCRELSIPKRGIGTKKSIRGSSTTWLWRPRDPNEAIEVECDDKDGININLDPKT